MPLIPDFIFSNVLIAFVFALFTEFEIVVFTLFQAVDVFVFKLFHFSETVVLILFAFSETVVFTLFHVSLVFCFTFSHASLVFSFTLFHAFTTPSFTLPATSFTLSQFAIRSATAATIAAITNTIGLANKNAKKPASAGIIVPVISPTNPPNTPPITPITGAIAPIAETTLPITIIKGPATATTPSITAITVCTGCGNLLNALATVLTTLARPDITGANAPPNSIAAFFISFIATCILWADVSFILSIADEAAPVLSPIALRVLLKSAVPPLRIASAPVPASELPHNCANASLSPFTLCPKISITSARLIPLAIN